MCLHTRSHVLPADSTSTTTSLPAGPGKQEVAGRLCKREGGTGRGKKIGGNKSCKERGEREKEGGKRREKSEGSR